ncbi:DUF4113 domain-containing protein [Halomonas sp. 1390]|uniref:DUF4113 domain-containing protein n=1 Tax=Halomonas sp. B23F22_3 TaxID=3459516 RepID=UPI00373E86EE
MPKRVAQRERAHQLMATLDELNEKIGKGTVRLGVPRSNAAWHLRCAHVRRSGTRSGRSCQW